MLGLRSARRRAILAGAVLIALLASVATLALWRAQEHDRRLKEVEQTSLATTALQQARAQFFRQEAAFAAVVFSGDPALVDDYQDAAAAVKQRLGQARAAALAEGDADEIPALDDLTERVGAFNDAIVNTIPLVLEADPETRVQLASAAALEMSSEVNVITAELDRLAETQHNALAAERAAADRAVDTTLWLLMAFSAAAFVVATGTVAMLVVSVVRPLASLRASARAITSGDLEARAKVSGPEEVASLARDFNEMTDALSAKTAEYIDTTNLTGDIIAKLDKRGRWLFLNDAACQFYGKPREELLGTDSRAFVHPEDLERTAQAVRETRAGKGLVTGFVNRQVTSMGARVVEWKGYPLFDGEGQYAGIQVTGRDITERKRAEEQLRESRQTLENITQGITETILLLSKDLEILWANNALLQQTGYEMAQVLGNHCYKVTHHRESPCDGRLDPCPIYELQETGETAVLTHTHFDADGIESFVEASAYPIKDEKGEVVQFVYMCRDITERKKAEEEQERLHAELEVRAITDSLTGLYDPSHFYHRLAEEIERSKRYNHGFAVVMMDVDNFKRFNDSRGHQAGDEMLCLVADCIRSGLRRSDLPFRYGGDEFAAILPHADSSKARAVVNRINGRIAKSLKQMDGGAEDRLSLSAGIACFPDDGTTGDDLVRIADAALYSAKWAARARDILGQREDIQSLISTLVSRRAGVEGPAGGAILRPEALHEQHARIVSTVASSIAVALKDAGVAQALEDPDLQILAVVSAAAEIKDRYIRGHPERTSEQAAALAEKMGLSPKRVRDIRIASLLHDIGKVTVSEGILNKPGKLTRREFASIKDHPIVGATLVSQVRGFERLVPIIRHHHERFDGKGYPDGLAGEEIPLEARILAVADVFDAMTHERAYRKALTKAEAIAELERAAGTQFDPAVVDAFLALAERRGEELTAPAQAAIGDRQLAAGGVAGRGKG